VVRKKKQSQLLHLPRLLRMQSLLTVLHLLPLLLHPLLRLPLQKRSNSEHATRKALI
jgi:hypothetical protein